MSSSKPGSRTRNTLALLIGYTRKRIRSTREASAYLAARGVPSHAALRALKQVVSAGLLDDRACSRLWAEHWARKGFAQAAIRQKLAQKGFEDPLISAAVSAVGAGGDDRSRALEAVARRKARGRAKRAQLARLLASRGFDSELIEEIVHAEQ